MPEHRTYPLEKSPLHGLQSKKKLYELLRTNKDDINKLLESKNNYVELQLTKKGKKRDIADPKKILKNIQANLLKFLSRISTPEYLFSGKKGVCYIDNARYHIPCRFVVTYDLRDFYPTCSREAVYRFFRFKLKMSEDTSWLLTDLTTHKGSLPHGSPCSQLLAYWAYQDMFDKIESYANQNKIRFSLYVDDMTLSSIHQTKKKMDTEISSIVREYGHSIKEKKTKRYYPSSQKEITGCIISSDNQLRVPNSKRKDIIDSIRNLKKVDGVFDSMTIKKAMGKVRAAKQIEPQIFNEIFSEMSVMAEMIEE